MPRGIQHGDPLAGTVLFPGHHGAQSLDVLHSHYQIADREIHMQHFLLPIFRFPPNGRLIIFLLLAKQANELIFSVDRHALLVEYSFAPAKQSGVKTAKLLGIGTVDHNIIDADRLVLPALVSPSIALSPLFFITV